MRLGRDLLCAGPARPRGRAWQFPQHQSGWPLFFALMSSFSKETEFTNFVSEEIAQLVPVTPRGGVTAGAPSTTLQPPRSTSWDRSPRIVLSRTAQHWRFGPSW